MLKRISIYLFVLLMACSEGGPDIVGAPTGNQTEFEIWSTANELIGVVVFKELDNDKFDLDVDLSTGFFTDISVEFVGDNGLDGKSSLGTFGTLESSSTFGEFESPSNLTVNYSDLADFDGHVGFFTGTKKIAFADIGENIYSGDIIEYDLFNINDPNVFGKALLRKRINEETVFIIDVEGTQAGDTHPCHFHRNTAAQGGSIVIDLNYVVGETGISMTNAVRQNNGAALSFESLRDFNGFIRIHKSDDAFNIAITEGDIGQNRFTGRSLEYQATSLSSDNISATIRFEERFNESILASVIMNNGVEDVKYPVIINGNEAADPGNEAINLNDVVGGEEVSYTEVNELDDGSPFTFDDLMDFDGHLNIYSEDMGTLLAQVDIGQNELTGNRIEYPVSAVNASGITGTIKFEERVNQQTLVTIELSGVSGNYEAKIVSGPASGNGSVEITLGDTDAQNGESQTNVVRRDNGQVIIYADMLSIDAHLEILDGSTRVAEADVGING